MFHTGLSLWRKLVHGQKTGVGSKTRPRRAGRRSAWGEFPAAAERLEDRTLLSNSAPVIDLNGADGAGVDFATTFTEDGGPVSAGDVDLTLIDVDGGVSGGGGTGTGDIFVVNSDGTIVRIDPGTGTQTAVGNSGALFAGPRGMAFESATGHLFVADNNPQIVEVDPVTGAVTVVPTGSLPADPWDVEFDANGDLIVTFATAAGDVIRIDPDTGAQTPISSGGLIGQAAGLAIESDGSILVGSFTNKSIVRINPTTGTQSVVSSAGSLNLPDDLTIESDGSILVAERNLGVIRVNPATGVQTLLASGGNLSSTRSVVVDAAGDIFTTNFNVHRIVRIDPTSGTQTVVTQGSPLNFPFGAAIETVASTDTIVSATVTITNLKNGSDESLSANTAGTGITAAYNSSTGVLSLTGADTAANYQGVLRTVSYNNTSQDPDPTARLITFTANDGIDQGPVATTTLTVVPVNDVPVINDGDLTLSSAAVNEAGSVTLNGVFTDPDFTQAHSVTIAWGDSTSTTINLAAGVLTFSAAHTYDDDDPTATPSDVKSIVVTVDDGSATDSAVTSVTVDNVAPHDVAIDAAVSELVFAVGDPKPFGGSFDDVGTADTHTALWTFSHVIDTATVTETRTGTVNQAGNTVNDVFSFAEAGVYTVTLTVTDDDTGATTSESRTFVVYNPSDGFVTGGGWITSPAGAYAPDAGLSGLATFAFVSKYLGQWETPQGIAVFNFHVGGMKFRSNDNDWLVVAGARAEYQGSGRINGAGDYGFRLTVLDGQAAGGGGTDKLRMKIWDKANGNAVVYDNGLGAPDDANPPTSLNGGAIIVHTNGQPETAVPESAGRGEVPVLTYDVLQPVVEQAIGHWEAAGASPDQIADLRGVDVQIASLDGDLLGMASGVNIVWIDKDAAGVGWSVTDTGSFSGFDLLSVVSHELGHMLGLDDVSDSSHVMGETFSPGVRRLPKGQLLDQPPQERSGSTATIEFALFELPAVGEFEASDVAAVDAWSTTQSETESWTGAGFGTFQDAPLPEGILDEPGTRLVPASSADLSGLDGVFSDLHSAAWHELLSV